MKQNNSPRSIGDLIEVPAVQTVIQLDEAAQNAESIATSFVFTADVTNHITILADALGLSTGRGFFMQGDFGSGKSHFLAALGAWLDRSAGSECLTKANESLQRLAGRNLRFLTVPVSLIRYRSSTPLERIIAEAIEKQLARHGRVFSLTPLSLFFDRFREILKEPVIAQAFEAYIQKEPSPPNESAIWLRENQREAYPVCIKFLKSQGMETPQTLVEERHELFTKAIDAVTGAGFHGLVLLIDELSEFFRAKPGAGLLNEDARTMQFLGEFSATRPLWIIAAVQESIERTGDIARATFRKIKDRFPVKLHLSTMHLRDLIAKRLVKHRPGAQKHIAAVYQDFKKHFPAFSCPWDLFNAIYPVHPATLSLLEGLGELFSQHRGIVDFVHAQLAGDPQRNIPGILDRPCAQLLAPDSIYEHFASRLTEFSSFYIYPRHIVPHLDSVIDTVLQEPADAVLARRLIRILVLYVMHPTAILPPVRQLAELSACMIAPYDPDVNVKYIAEVLLDPVVEHSRFLTKELSAADPLDARYRIVTRDDHGKILKARVQRAIQELPDQDSRLLSEPLTRLQASISWPGPEILETCVERTVSWRLSTRRAVVAFLHADSVVQIEDRIRSALETGRADFALVITAHDAAVSCQHTAVWRTTVPKVTIGMFKDFLAHRMILQELSPSNPADIPLIPLMHERIGLLEKSVQQEMLAVIYAGSFDDPHIAVDPAALQIRRFDRLLEAAGEYLLEQRYPHFKDIASQFVTPSPRLYQRLFEEFVVPGSISLAEARTRGLHQAIDSIAAPLGLVEVRSGVYRISPNPQEHAFLSHVFDQLTAIKPTPLCALVTGLQTGPYGVLPDMADFLLLALAHCGLISLLSGGKTLPLEFLNSSAAARADMVAPGELLSQADREFIQSSCPFLAPQGGFSGFGLRQQREVWQTAIKLKHSLEQLIASGHKSLVSLGEYSAFVAFDQDGLNRKFALVSRLIDEIKVSYPAREGLERFVQAWRELLLSADDLDLLRKLDRFFRQRADHFIFISHYVRSRSVETATHNDPQTARYLDAVREILREPEKLVVRDEGQSLEAAFEAFRRCYAEYYEREHSRYYAAPVKQPLSKYSQRIMTMLRRLALIRSLDQPPGIEKLVQWQDTPDKFSCNRTLREELVRSPVCGCNFKIGDVRQEETIADPQQLVEESMQAYLKILGSPLVLENISAWAFSQKDVHPDRARHLTDLVKQLERSDFAACWDLLDEQAISDIDRALSAATVIEQRGIERLARQLSGRRLTPGKIRSIVDEWIGDARQDTIVSIEAPHGLAAQKQKIAGSWWLRLRPDLHAEKSAALSQDEIIRMQRYIESLFPAEELSAELAALSDDRLARFISGETIHAAAAHSAWVMLANRVCNRAVAPGVIGVSCGLLNPAEQASCIRRLKTLAALVDTMRMPLPLRLRARIHCAALIHDPLATRELQRAAEALIVSATDAGNDWLRTLPVLQPVDCSSRPVVIIIDSLAPDIWLESLASMEDLFQNSLHSWYRLESEAKTIPAMNSLFGFDPQSDPAEAFHAAGTDYILLDGNESRPAIDLIPPVEAQSPCMVIRLGMIDTAVHSGSMQLADMPEAVRKMCGTIIPRMLETCSRHKRPLILTTDHGLSFVNKHLSHGADSVFEKAVFRVSWQET